MTFDRNKFALISAGFPGVTPRIWGYETTDTFQTVLEPASSDPVYFTNEKGNLIEGDIINVRFLTQGGPMFGMLKVRFNDPTGTSILVVIQAPFVFNVLIPDVSTAQSVYVGLPSEVQIIGYSATVYAPLTVADANLSLKNNGGLILGSNMTLPFGGVAGATPTVYTDDDVQRLIQPETSVEVVTDGGSTSVVAANITLLGL